MNLLLTSYIARSTKRWCLCTTQLLFGIKSERMDSKVKVEHSQESRESDIRNDSLNFVWALKPLTYWMRFLGFRPTVVSSNGNSSYWHWFILILIFLLVLSMHIALVINICLNAKSVATSYINGYPSGAVACNFIIDGLNLSIYIIVNHAFLIFLTRPKNWKVIKQSFQLLEKNSSATLEIYKKCRKTITVLMISVVVTV